TLTAGNGGNGTDELEFRTSNGTWSAWADYTSGANISTADLSGVEIRTRRTASTCSSSAYTTVGWNVEATPITGTLAKTPNVLNVCENDIVSATLTAGNGGNGIDELEFRTNNGTWSVWAAYTSGANISCWGLSSVEIRTRRSASTCEPSVYTVATWNVNPLPVPVINGSNSVCLNSTGHTYSTAANMTNYSWAISAGGTITAGANTSTITVNWNATGEQSVSVNYINENGCTAQNATIFEVTVNPLPLPSINGRNFLCAGTSGEIYTTEPGMTNYSWTISDGGIITSGALTNTITVTWNNDTSQGLSVNYINENGCTAPSATFYDVTVASLPVPTITGPAFVCAGESEATYTTQSSMSGYDWSVSPGGVITSGNGTNQITITWNTDGPQTVSVNYTNANGCTAENPSVMDVTVRPLPTYSFDISATEICSGGTVDFINYFSGVAPWTVVYSYNGAQSSFTTSNNPDYYSEVFTETTENRIISVTDGNGCTAMINTVTIITVNPLPVPTISGAALVCEGATGETYTTESGMTDYNWAVSEGGTITSGAGTNTITVDWSGEESQTVSVVYTNENGCSALNASVLEITMNPLPQPEISGPESVCAGTNGVIYTTDDQMSDYNWTISSGGSITSGNGTHEITVHWYVAGNHVINVNYTNSNACTSVIPGMIEVEVNPLPAAAGTITGTPTVCAGTQGMVYSVPAIANASICFWTLPAGAEIVSGFGTNSITVDFNNTASSGIITVRGANSCGQGAASPIFQVQVNPIPEKPVITQIGQILTSSATEGNQWFFNGIEIPGATSQQIEALNSGEYSVMVTLDGCNSQMSDIITVIITGTIENLALQEVEIYPNPNHGEFTLSVSSEKLKNMDLQILTSLGVVIYEKADLNVQGKLIEKIKLSGIAPGIYFVKLSTSDQQLIRKVIIH
ncbi:MAG: T9SS type A sorting domain-containing protein, partial [Lentimicrobium sp.]|nr:T9SS type A sorting domain-containing protein [Lentimicrobium sp.]